MVPKNLQKEIKEMGLAQESLEKRMEEERKAAMEVNFIAIVTKMLVIHEFICQQWIAKMEEVINTICSIKILTVTLACDSKLSCSLRTKELF